MTGAESEELIRVAEQGTPAGQEERVRHLLFDRMDWIEAHLPAHHDALAAELERLSAKACPEALAAGADKRLLGEIRTVAARLTAGGSAHRAVTFTPDFLSRYRVESLLAEGGMGSVFRGVQIQLERPVAIKVLSSEVVTPDLRQRFRAEARVAATTFHPHLVAVIEAGQLGDVPYIVFELVEGTNLRQRLEEAGGPLPVGEALEVARQAAEGLACAHQAGIVHRDVKPENLLLTPDGTVKVADFGVARANQGPGVRQTQAGVIVGTPLYMSPEQAGGKSVGAASDVYCLGLVLYEMIAGTNPFRGDNALQIMHHQVHLDPAPLPEATPRPVERLVAKAMAKDPRDRFASMAELSEELARVAQGLIALPTAERERRQSPTRRTPVFMLPTALTHRPPGSRVGLALGAVAAVVALTLVGWRVHQQRSAVETVSVPRAATANAIVQESETETAPERAITGLKRGVRGVAYTPSTTQFVSAGIGTPMKLFDARTAKPLREMPSDDALTLAVSPDGRHAATGHLCKEARLWDLTTGKLVRTHAFGSMVKAVAFSRDGAVLAVGGYEPVVRFWEVTGGRALGEVPCEPNGINALAYSPDGKSLAGGGDDNVTRVWSVIAPGVLKSRMTLRHRGDVRALAWTPDSTVLVSADDAETRLWEVAKGAASSPLAMNRGRFRCVGVSRDGTRVAAGNLAGQVLVWNIATRAVEKQLRVETQRNRGLLSVAFEPGDGAVVAGGEDFLLHRWVLLR